MQSTGELIGRGAERQALDQLITDLRAGRSRVLVLSGEAGAGKSALLDYLARQATGAGCRVACMPGAESETELAFAAVQQLCAPMLGRAERLPVPQRDALRMASGLAAGPPPDRFFVGLAVLSLLAGVAAEGPLLCLVDDEQWLDRASAQALGFAARRLGADPVGLVFAARGPGAELAGLPELEVGGLRDADARALLDSALAGPLDERVRDLIVAEARGNPAALLAVARGLSPADLAGGFGLPGAAPVTDRIRDQIADQLDDLPERTRRLVRLAAAEPSGDLALVWRAAGHLGLPVQDGAVAGLVEFGLPVRFGHPLARAAIYRSTALAERQQIHAALAEATDPAADPDRRAWHRAQAAAGPDDEVAAELERSAGRARVRGGLAAAAAFGERAAALTADPARRTERILTAARASMQAGAFGQAAALLAGAESGPLDELARARAELLHGQIAFASGSAAEAAPLLLAAARRLAALDPGSAAEAYLSALSAGQLLEVGREARSLPRPALSRPALPRPAPARSALSRPALPRPAPARAVDLVLDGLARAVTDGLSAAVPALRRAVRTLVEAGLTEEEALRWGWLAPAAASALWDHDAWRVLLARQVRLARAAGALDQLPVMLDALGTAVAAAGDFAAAAALSAEAAAARERTGVRAAPLAATLLASLRGEQAEAGGLIQASRAEAPAYAHWAAAILHNGLGRYEEALTAARQATEDLTAPHIWLRALPELVEAAARSADAALARDAVKQLAEVTQACGTDVTLGIEARCRAQLSDGATADGLYREAIDRLSRTQLRPELARARLLYGEWLRRDGQRRDARQQLRAAHDLLTAIGMDGFAERARHELAAAGETTRKRGQETGEQLTPQEEQIARLARDGLSNPEIGARLFLSARTVEWHLSKVFSKLGISSRRDLGAALTRAA